MGTIKGLSLAEAVIALFLLTAGILVAASAFQRSIHLQNQSLQQRRATVLAQNLLARLQVHRDNFQGGSWSEHWRPFQDLREEQDGYLVRLRSRSSSVASPCSSLEESYSTRQRLISEAASDFQIEVRWGSGPKQSLKSCIRLAAPAPRIARLELSRLDSGKVRPTQMADLRVRALDASGREVSGLVFGWRIDSDSFAGQPGMGTLVSSGPRTQTQMQVFHGIYRPDGRLTFAPGEVRITAWCLNQDGPIRSQLSLELDQNP